MFYWVLNTPRYYQLAKFYTDLEILFSVKISDKSCYRVNQQTVSLLQPFVYEQEIYLIRRKEELIICFTQILDS